jgi:hypothetical protein
MSPRAIAMSMGVLGLVIGAAGGAVLATSDVDGQMNDRLLLLVAAAFNVGMVIGGIACIPYWRRLDEAAREAHKAAWLWGSMGVLYLALGGAAFIFALQPALALPEKFGGASPATWLAVGLTVACYAQMIGYLIAWAIWWMRKR